jgi:hypothetical protein
MRLEPMEGRLMLSGSIPDVFVFNQMTAWTFADSVTTATGGAEGGPIGFPYRSAVVFNLASLDAVDITPQYNDGVVDVGALYGNSGGDVNANVQFSNGAGYTVSREHTFVLGQPGGALVDWTVNNLQPVSIFQQTPPESTPTIPAPLGEDADGAATTHFEGGIISIESIIASTELEVGAEPGERQTKSIAAVSTGVADPQESLVETPAKNDRAMSSEWARAIVFETAGGEPTTAIRPLVHGVRPSASESRPREHDFSAARLQGRAVQDSSSKAAAYVRESSEATFASLARTLSISRRLDPSSDSESLSSLTRANVLESEVMTPYSHPFRLTDSARAEAFEQLVESEDAATHWLARYSRRALTATPLLLVLALERVAARKSRRPSAQGTFDPPRLRRKSNSASDEC